MRLCNLGQKKKEQEVNRLQIYERRGQARTRGVFRLLLFFFAKIRKSAMVGDARLINARRESDSRSVNRIDAICPDFSTRSVYGTRKLVGRTALQNWAS